MGKVDPGLLEHLARTQDAGAPRTIFLFPCILVKGCDTPVGLFEADADTGL